MPRFALRASHGKNQRDNQLSLHFILDLFLSFTLGLHIFIHRHISKIIFIMWNKLRFLLQVFAMKVAVLCAVFSVLALTFSQPTYEPEQQEALCEGVCQQDDLKTLQKQFTAQFTALKNEISQLLQLKEQVDKVLQIYDGYSGNTVNETELPGSYPTSPSEFITQYYSW